LIFFSLDENKTKGKETHVGKPLLNRDLDGVSCKQPWLYCSAVGMLSYLSNSVRTEIQIAVHQTAWFSVNPMQSHKLAIMRIGRYLVDNPERGIQYKIDKSKGLEVYVDADFAGGWSAADSENADNVLSRTALLSVMLTVLLYGAASFRLKLLFLLQRQSILLCLMLFVRQYQSRIS
jgi:hypothetical protein